MNSFFKIGQRLRDAKTEKEMQSAALCAIAIGVLGIVGLVILYFIANALLFG